MPDGEKTKLIVHIGAGKTGSTSIQSTLRENQKVLAENGCKYLGMMLEKAQPRSSYDWQQPSGSPMFFSLTPDLASMQLYDLLKSELLELSRV